MVDIPSLDRYDLAAAVSSLCILAVAYLIYSTEFSRIAAWLSVFTIYVCWMGYFLWKWM